ncbi:DUF2285 domain-containing protein [Sphingobium sp. DEHP117]|uniref:DUF2285 domain-containing protein n=1 Tax=Sphingobium sp. DEHP117 TaxID=2993436 RepID=UPI0027D6A38E|nr:DUF2285 domain-containing protein [Sphingobium sp. DEHP117]MDQ4420215.1 DUF2285 domain-containing protein [Sphingobium sp. DEHP117]
MSPALDAREAAPIWAPTLNTGVVLLTAPPAILPKDDKSPTIKGHAAGQSDAQGFHFLHRLTNGERLQILRFAGASGAEGTAAVIPLGPDGFDRLEAVARLLSSLHGRSVPADTRLTRQQRHRARRMLQAVDGRLSGASYREIAAILFGTRDLADEPWKTSSRRFATMELVRGGLAMIAGGYRRLLSHRRRR